jgi:hypothetical protein
MLQHDDLKTLDLIHLLLKLSRIYIPYSNVVPTSGLFGMCTKITKLNIRYKQSCNFVYICQFVDDAWINLERVVVVKIAL